MKIKNFQSSSLTEDKIKKGDFVEIEYTGTIKEEGIVFDTTSEETAKKNNIYNEKKKYKPVAICVGQGQILKGLDKKIEGKKIGSYDIELTPEEAFGKKNAKLLQLVPLNKFKAQGINPVTGMHINVDGIMGTVKTATGGRVIVDFNHPLSGREIKYTVKINKILKGTGEKLKAFIKFYLDVDDSDIELKEGVAVIKLKEDISNNIKEELTKKVKELIKLNIQFIKKET